MKHRVFTALLVFIGSAGFTQSLFFDNLKRSVWTADQSLDDSTIRAVSQIELTRLKVPRDSLRTSLTLLTFGDQLVVTHYNAEANKDSIVTRWKYEFDHDRGRLNITPEKGRKVRFAIGIVSTASYVLLMRRKQ